MFCLSTLFFDMADWIMTHAKGLRADVRLAFQALLMINHSQAVEDD